MGGNLLYLCGMVDKRTLEKYEREAKEAGRESWYLSWALDSTSQEREKVGDFLSLRLSSIADGVRIGRVKQWKSVGPTSRPRSDDTPSSMLQGTRTLSLP